MAKFIDRLRLCPQANPILPTMPSIKLLALICCLGLTACASLSIPKQPSDDYIAGLLAENQFDTALKAVDQWQDNYPNDLELPKQRKHITQAISRFESTTLATAQQLDNKGQWQEAKSVYESALEKVPSSPALQNAYSEFSVRHLTYLNGLKEDLDVAQARHWLNISADIKALYQAAPNDPEARAWQEKSHEERERLARRMVNYGLAHEEKEHFGTAALRYDLAYQLDPGEFTKPYHERAVKTFAQRKAKQKKRAREDQKRQRSKLSLLIEEFDQHLAQREFRLARKTLRAMEVIDAKSPEVLKRRDQLDQQRSIALNQAIQDGKNFYTKGEFDNAIDAWQRALRLDPDNKELKENIQRAEKFRENLQRLKQGS